MAKTPRGKDVNHLRPWLVVNLKKELLSILYQTFQEIRDERLEKGGECCTSHQACHHWQNITCRFN